MRFGPYIALLTFMLLLVRCSAVDDATRRSDGKEDDKDGDTAGDEEPGDDAPVDQTDGGILEDGGDDADPVGDDDGDDEGDGTTVTPTGTTQTGVVFCQAAGDPLKLDVAVPDDDTPNRPGLIFVHGGGWTSGSRSAFTKETKAAAARGYVAATIDYRLTGALFPGQVEDVKCAVRWLRANAETYGVDPDRIALVDKSAGAHLSMLAGFTDPGVNEGSGGHDDTPSQVKVVIDWYGPADLAALYQGLPAQKRIGMELLLGGTPANAAGAYAAASPVTHLDAADPALFIAHGTADGTVPISQSQGLNTKAGNKNMTHAFETIQGAGHGFKDADYEFVVDKTFEFLDANL